MSKILLIRHLPPSLSFLDKEQLLKHFGAEKVWETNSKKHYIFASFSTEEQAKTSLFRLHQLEIAQKRLVVEYSFEKEPVSQTKWETTKTSDTKNYIEEFLRNLNAWNPSVDFYQPPPTNINYKYPDVTPTTLMNIIFELVSHKPFYIQTLHLMNKMSLKNPFKEDEKALEYFKEVFRVYFPNEIAIPCPESGDESEMSSDENQKVSRLPVLMKRQHKLPNTRKRAAAVLSTALSYPKAKRKAISQKEVFEGAQIQEPKKISVVVNQDALQKQPQPESQVVGELGMFQKEEKPSIESKPHLETELPTITKKELFQNRISYSDMKVLPIFKNYHPGQPSMRLYIKNLAKTVTDQDVKSIYRRYIEKLDEDEQIGFDVRVMQEGRMKGQGFVTFPSVQIAETALNDTNGYMLKERPMVVQFARVAKKKTID